MEAGEPERRKSRLEDLQAATALGAEDLTLTAALERMIEFCRRTVRADFGALETAGEAADITVESGHCSPTGMPGGGPAAGHPDRISGRRLVLKVPIQAKDTVYAYLHLSRHGDSPGFTSGDEALVASFAELAGLAIDNAWRRRHWLGISLKLTRDLPAATEDEDRLIVQHALAASGAELVLLATLDSGGNESRCRAAAGTRTASVDWRDLPLNPGPLKQAMDIDSPLLCGAAELLTHGSGSLGAAVIAPVSRHGSRPGLLIVCRAAGTGQFPPVDVDMLQVFCEHASLALELVQGQHSREQLMLFTDRDRIARDLNDLVIQRLFALGLEMQTLRRFTADEPLQQRITALTAALDDIITQVRDTIYSLTPEPDVEESLSARIVHTVYEATNNSNCIPRLQFEGLVDTALHGPAARHLLAVLSEGLNHSVHHARARTVSICVAAAEDRISLTIDDDGHGNIPPGRTGRLNTLEQHARALNATLDTGSTPGQGTHLRWEAPAGNGHR
jgi:signal transduction histidine kinase